MKVLIACEYSGTLRDKLINIGIDAISCDLLEGEGEHWDRHYQGDVFDLVGEDDTIRKAFGINGQFDIMIGHPTCTYLTNSGVCHLWSDKPSKGNVLRGFERYQAMIDGANFFNDLMNVDIPIICLENPIPHKYARAIIGNYTQLVQPYHHGHEESKATCYWLKGLPKLFKTKVVKPVNGSVMHKLPPTKDRWKLRSKSYSGIAQAMVEQWFKPLSKGI